MKKILVLFLVLVLLTACTKNKIIGDENAIEWVQGEMGNNEHYLLYFFNAYCTICTEQGQELKEINEKIPEVQVIGINVPEFEFQKKADILKTELERNEINYAVVSDRNQSTRIKYSQDRVPGFVNNKKNDQILDKTADLRQIKARLLKLYPDRELALKSPSHIISEKTTPRLYGGYNYARSPFGNIEKEDFETWKNFSLSGTLLEDRIYVYGEWYANQDRLNFISVHPGAMLIKFYGSEVSLLSRSKNFQNVTVLIDDMPIPKENAGKDLRYNENEESYFVAEPDARVFNIAKYADERKMNLAFYPDATRFNLFWIEFS